MKRYSLITLFKSDFEDVKILTSSNSFDFIMSRFKMLTKYMKYFKTSPKTRRQWKNIRNIEIKLKKEFHNKSLTPHIFDLVFNSYICIKDNETKKIFSNHRFHSVRGGFVPFETPPALIKELKEIEKLISSPWQDLNESYSFNYFNVM